MQGALDVPVLELYVNWINQMVSTSHLIDNETK